MSHKLEEGLVIFHIEETQYNTAVNYRVPVEFAPAQTTVVLCRFPLSFPIHDSSFDQNQDPETTAQIPTTEGIARMSARPI